MPNVSAESAPTINRWKRVERDPPPEGEAVEYAEDGKVWRPVRTKTIRRSNGPFDAEAERARIEAKQEAEFERHVIDVMKARYLAEFDNN